MKTGVSPGSASLDDLVERIAPAVSPLLGRGLQPAELMSAATRANVMLTCERLRRESPILAERIRSGKLVVVSAEYALETGEVSFFDATCAVEAAAA